MKTLVLLPPGVEEMEAVIVVDCLRRAELEVLVAGLTDRQVIASRGVNLVADVLLAEIETTDVDRLVLPGGMGGTLAMCGDERVLELVRQFAGGAGRHLACICAAAMVLDQAGVLEGRRFTCHPSVADRIPSGTRLDDRVVVDGNLTSSQGPGTAFEFALELIRQSLGDDAAASVAGPMILPN